MKTLLVVAFVAAIVGLVLSLVVLYKLVTKKNAHRLEY